VRNGNASSTIHVVEIEVLKGCKFYRRRVTVVGSVRVQQKRNAAPLAGVVRLPNAYPAKMFKTE